MRCCKHVSIQISARKVSQLAMRKGEGKELEERSAVSLWSQLEALMPDRKYRLASGTISSSADGSSTRRTFYVRIFGEFSGNLIFRKDNLMKMSRDLNLSMNII